MHYPFARRAANVRPSTIREILKVATQPGVISFAGGLPAPELFPLEDIRAACARVLERTGPQALQYGSSEGYPPLREYIAREMASRGGACDPSDILLTTGSQQAIDLTGRILLDPGDVVLTESPTYLAAIQAFQWQEARLVGVPTDGDGIIPESLPGLLKRHKPKFLYTIPNFQNPSGITLAATRRRRLYAIAAEHNLLIVEDDPYGKLRYRGEDIAPLKALDTQGLVIYTSTFSKTIAPGLRVGWLAAAPGLMARLLVAKQAADLHTSSLDQRIVCEYAAAADVAAHIARIRTAYGERFGTMYEALHAEMPGGFTWTHPDGGMFLWMCCPQVIDTNALLEAAVAHEVFFVPGRDFFADGRGANYLRLNFSNCPPERIREGIARLAALCREYPPEVPEFPKGTLSL